MTLSTKFYFLMDSLVESSTKAGDAYQNERLLIRTATVFYAAFSGCVTTDSCYKVKTYRGESMDSMLFFEKGSRTKLKAKADGTLYLIDFFLDKKIFLKNRSR